MIQIDGCVYGNYCEWELKQSNVFMVNSWCLFDLHACRILDSERQREITASPSIVIQLTFDLYRRGHPSPVLSLSLSLSPQATISVSRNISSAFVVGPRADTNLSLGGSFVFFASILRSNLCRSCTFVHIQSVNKFNSGTSPHKNRDKRRDKMR